MCEVIALTHIEHTFYMCVCGYVCMDVSIHTHIDNLCNIHMCVYAVLYAKI